METKSNIGIHNRFDVEVIDTITGKIKQKARGYNVVCNNLFARLSAGKYDYATYIQYGSGTGTPSASDTQLFNFVGAINPSYDDDVHTDRCHEGICSVTRKIVLNPSVAVGITLTEVGLAYSNSNGSLCTHAMLQDMNGNPLTITKTNTDIINIYATIYLHWDASGDFQLYSGSGQNDSYNGYIYASSPLYERFLGISRGTPDYSYGGGEMGHLWGLNGRLNCTEYAGYVPWVFKRKDKSVGHDTTNKRTTVYVARFEANEVNNVGGIGRFVYLWNCSSYGSSAANYNFVCRSSEGGRGIWLVIEAGGTVIPPSQITDEAAGVGDGTTTDFAVKFSFPYDAEIKINGVVQNQGVTVIRGPVNTDKLWNFMDTRSVNYPKRPVLTNITTNANIWYNGYSYYNYAYDLGIASVNASSGSLYGSDDGENWTLIHTFSGSETYTLTGHDQHYKYYKPTAQMNYTWNTWNGKAIKFTAPPANGDVITITYKTPFVAKDENHVYDLNHTFTFGEWTGE